MKLRFGLKGYYRPTPKKLKKISAFVETVFATVGTSALLTSHPTASALCLIAAGITNKFFELFYDDEETTNNLGGDNAA